MAAPELEAPCKCWIQPFHSPVDTARDGARLEGASILYERIRKHGSEPSKIAVQQNTDRLNKSDAQKSPRMQTSKLPSSRHAPGRFEDSMKVKAHPAEYVIDSERCFTAMIRFIYHSREDMEGSRGW